MNESLKTIVVIGGTGLIGRHLVFLLKDSNYNIKVLARDLLRAKQLFGNDIDIAYWDGKDSKVLVSHLNEAFAVVNLSGSTIAVRWTNKAKEKIYQSRIGTTRAVVNAINTCEVPPKALIQASAIGYYSYDSEFQFDESSPKGSGFLSNLVSDWEIASKSVNINCRLVNIRTGIVLSSNGGFLEKLINPIRFFVGGWFGNGRQNVSWIHIDDHISAIRFLIEDENCFGPFNLVSPNPISFKQFAKVVGREIRRPVWLPVPKFILRILFGKMANEIICSNQSIIPEKLLTYGFVFRYNKIEEALGDLLREK